MLALALALATTVAIPPPDDLTALFGNTLVTVDGRIESHFYYNPDHTFTGAVPQYHFDLKGRWRENPDGSVCRVFDPPVPRVKNPDCGPILVHAVGETKTFDNGDSQELVPGIQ
jgi:hypothetical protein